MTVSRVLYNRQAPSEVRSSIGLPAEKGSGETSLVESLNTKWRQRPSGLARRCCGVSRRVETDLIERFFLLVEQHNGDRAKWPGRTERTTHASQ